MAPHYFLAVALLVVASQGAPPELNNVSAEAERTDNFDERGPYEGGDMIITPEQRAESRSGILGDGYRWKGCKIPYLLARVFRRSERETILAGMKDIEDKTVLSFVERTNEPDYIYITGEMTGCWSHVGRQGGRQQVNLQRGNPGCVFSGIVSHELLHASGLFHEQSRTDRDDYVTINWQNIQSGTEHNFDKYNSTQVDSYGVAYNYGSIMHYSATAFSKNGQQTITPKDPRVRASSLGQRVEVSALDAELVDKLYEALCE